jgi:parallel beta-helix repeat protein
MNPESMKYQYASFFLLSLVLTINLAIWIISASEADAATYYVATTGNDSNPGTEVQPWRTLQKAAHAVQSGDTVLVKEGRYPAFTIRKKNGNASARITFKPFPGHKVTVDQYLGGGNGFEGIGIYSSSHLVFEGFEITHSDPNIDAYRQLDPCSPAARAAIANYHGRRGIAIRQLGGAGPSHHLTFKNLEIHHTPSSGIGALNGDDHHFEVLNNHFYDIGGVTEGYGIYLRGLYHVVRGNISHDNKGGHGLRLGSNPSPNPFSHGVVEENITYNNGGTHWHAATINGKIEWRCETGGSGITLWHGNNNIIRNNISYNNLSDGIRIIGYNSVIENNTVYNNSRIGINIEKAHRNIVMKNNTVYKNKAGDATVLPGNPQSNNLFGVNPLLGH